MRSLQQSSAAYGAPRNLVTQALMMNSTAKEHRQHDLVDEMPYESVARNNRTIGNNREEQPDGS